MQYAQRIQHLTGSVAREILSRCENQSITSFAGGLPGREAWQGVELPVPDARAFQYGASEGDSALRSLFAQRLLELGLKVTSDQMIVTTGSQQGLDLVSKLWIDPGAPIAVESPTYLAALQVFQLFQAGINCITARPDGLDLKELERVLELQRPRFIYLNPTFQNPTGYCYAEDNRKAIAALLDRYADSTVLIEDDPYRALSYDSAHAPAPILCHLKQAKWVYLGSTSKVIIPGARIGYLAASEGFVPELQKLKQASDLHSSRLSQQMVLQLLGDSSWVGTRMQYLQQVYREKRDVMQEVLMQCAGDLADWSLPQGGMFFWLKLRAPCNLREILDRCLQRGVAFMPGDSFFADKAESGRWIRLNFTSPDAASIREMLPVVFETLRNHRV